MTLIDFLRLVGKDLNISYLLKKILLHELILAYHMLNFHITYFITSIWFLSII